VPPDVVPVVAASVLEVTIVLAAALLIDAVAAPRVRPSLRHAAWIVVAFRLARPGGWIAAPATVAEMAGLPFLDARVMPGSAVTTSVVMVWVWAAGVLGCAIRWGWHSHRLRARWSARDSAADDGLTRRVRAAAVHVGLRWLPRVALDPLAPTPYVTGLFRPWLVLPLERRHLPEGTLDHALSHELMHLRRRDLAWDAFWMVIAAAYWFHPLVHVARGRAHQARELCCDAAVAAVTGPAYRRALLRVIAEAAGERPRAAPGHAWHPAIERLRALERWPRPASRRRRAGAGLVVTLMAGAVLPSWIATVPTASVPAPLDRLLDPVSRQEMGAGSLHLRYALVGASQAAERSAPDAAPRR
jgi:beta-lactamase regulating signal transducer with metallopeptidase domain